MATNQSNKIIHELNSKDNTIRNRGNNHFLKHPDSSSIGVLGPNDPYIMESHKRNDVRQQTPPTNNKRAGSIGSVPPRPDSSQSRRTPTPTKQVALQAVRRKEERNDPIVADVDWKELQSYNRHKEKKQNSLTDRFDGLQLSDEVVQPPQSSIPFSYHSRHHNCSHHQPVSVESHREENKELNSASKPETKPKAAIPKELSEENKTGTRKDKKDEETQEEDDSDEESSSEEEERKAPNQLLMEFLTCLMEKDYENAAKLCKMILLYEPNNPEALKFQPLIEEKIALDNEPESSGESDDDGNEDDIDDDDDDSDSDEDDDSETDTSESDSDEEEESEATEIRLDSGIASAVGSEHSTL